MIREAIYELVSYGFQIQKANTHETFLFEDSEREDKRKLWSCIVELAQHFCSTDTHIVTSKYSGAEEHFINSLLQKKLREQGLH